MRGGRRTTGCIGDKVQPKRHSRDHPKSGGLGRSLINHGAAGWKENTAGGLNTTVIEKANKYQYLFTFKEIVTLRQTTTPNIVVINSLCQCAS